MTRHSLLRRDKAVQFMRQARFVANEFSKDRSTKVGALILDPEDYAVLTQGYNGMPRGIDESLEERHTRPLKYAFFEHAERNALYNRMRPLLKGSLVVTTRAPTIGCVRALLSVGASYAYFPQWSADDADAPVARALLSEAGVVVGHTVDGVLVGDDRHARKVTQYAKHAALTARSLAKDPQASVALFLTPSDFTQLTMGYSGLPRGADDERIERYVEPLRAQWVETSIRNAIYNAARQELKGSVALVTATTCVECARGLASSGIREVIYIEPSAEFTARWGASNAEALSMLEELGLTVTKVTHEQLDTPHP